MLYISRSILRWTDIYIIHIVYACTQYTRTLIIVSIVLAPPINHIQVYSAHADYYTTDQGGGGGKETTVASAACPPGCLRSDRRPGPYVVVAASEQRQQISHTRSAHYWLIIIVQPVGRLRVVLLSRGDHTRAMV